LSRTALGPTQPTVHWVPGLSRVKCSRGVTLTTHPFQCRGYGRVELYLYPPSGRPFRVHLQEGTRYFVPKRRLHNIPEELRSENATRSPYTAVVHPCPVQASSILAKKIFLFSQRFCTQISCQTVTLQLVVYYFWVKTTWLRLINGCRETLHSIAFSSMERYT